MRKRNYKAKPLDEIVDYAYDLRSTIEEVLYDEGISIAYVIRYIAALGSMVGCLIGASAGLGLSFTALSPLVIGGVIAAVFPALLALVFVGARYYFHDEINELKEEASPMKEKHVIAALMAFFIPMTVTSMATGVGLAAATDTIFPGIFATWYSVAVGAGIGAITLLAGITLVAIIAEKFAGNLVEYIIPDQCLAEPQVTSQRSLQEI